MVEKSDLSPNPANWWQSIYEPVRQFGERVAEFLSPSSDASVTTDQYEINIELPGVEDDDIVIEAHDNRLTVTGEKRSSREEKGRNYYFSERSFGQFRRAFQLPADADQNRIDASFRNGLLTIRVAKKQNGGEASRKIQINKS